MLRSMKQYFIDNAPEWLFALATNISHSRSSKENIHISRYDDGWLVKRDEIKLRSPTARFYGISMKTFESKFEKYFSIKKGDVVMDVGASLGDTTVIMGMKVGSTGKVIAVEPEPTNLKYLTINTKELGNVEILDYAAWKSEGIMSLNVHSGPTGHSLVWGYERTVKVKTDTLDNLTRKYAKIDYVKIDVQGVEVDILKKATELFGRCNKWVIETHFRSDSEKATYPEVIKIMKDAGFETHLHDGYVVYGLRP